MAGQWTGLQNGFGNLSGIVAAWLTGITVERTGSFQLAFVLAAACALCGALMWGVVAGPVKQAPWSSSFESKC
jgi:cyanate permease